MSKQRSKKKKITHRRSGFEDKFEKFLKSNKIKYRYEPYAIQYTIPERSAKYFPDFEIKTRSGKTILIETKGKFTPQDRRKMALVVAQNPLQDIRMVLMRNNYIRKGSTTTYGMWCDKNNIKWAIGKVPDEWL